MANDIAILEGQLKPLSPRFAEVLGQSMPVERLIRTVVLSVERLPRLLECDRQSLFNAAMSAAVLGLEVDGVTGQAFLIPFKNRAQLVIGYKGYNTMAARSGITITGKVVREGDKFDYDLAEGWVMHKPELGNKGRIIAAWAKAAASGRPAIVEVLSIDELMAVKAKSPGAARSDSPWNDPTIGFPAMCEKTVKRRLARSLPLNIMHLAARMDEAVDEQGHPAHISPDKSVVIDGEVLPPREPSPTPTAEQLMSPRGDAVTEPASATKPPSSLNAGAGEVASEPGYEDIIAYDNGLTAAAKLGSAQLKSAWANVPHRIQPSLKSALDNRHKPAAAEVDKSAVPTG